MVGHCFLFMVDRGLEKAMACNSSLGEQTELLSLVSSSQVPLALGGAALASIPGICFVYFCFQAPKANLQFSSSALIFVSSLVKLVQSSCTWCTEVTFFINTLF